MNQLKKRMLSLAAATAVAGGLGLVTAPGAQAATSSSVWDAVAACESTNNWSINTGNGFYGGLQFSQSTWTEFGGTAYAARADLATKDQQIAIAQKVLAVQGPVAWPVCSGVAGLTAANGGASSGTTGSSAAVTSNTASSSSIGSAATDSASTLSGSTDAGTSTSDSGTSDAAATGSTGPASERASAQGRTQSAHASDRAKQRAALRAQQTQGAESSGQAQSGADGQQRPDAHRSGACADAR